jgi:RimJ/RimL family protein N-acetyltransferase
VAHTDVCHKSRASAVGVVEPRHPPTSLERIGKVESTVPPSSCRFETERLTVAPWHSIPRAQLASHVAALLTPAVTRPLPPPWQGPYDLERAQRWIDERDAESSVLLVSTRADATPVGLIILSSPQPSDTELRLGYLLAEGAWGRGLGSELIAGLVQWCGAQPDISSLAGGVEASNPASKRVLEKNGFVVAETLGERQVLRLVLNPS